MTHFHDRNHPRVDAWVTPGDDDLDDFLNANVASGGSPDVDSERNAPPLAASAREFHRKLDGTQGTDSRTAQPRPDLWNRILADSDNARKDNTMSSAPLSLDVRPASAGSPSPTRSVPAPRHSRLGRWANAFAAVSLVMLLAIGFWFSGYGPGGPGENNDPRYAAQIVSPAASPDAGVGCTVEPLSTDQIIAYVENPYSYLPRDAFGTPAPGEEAISITADLLEAPQEWRDVTSITRGEVPSEAEFESAYAVADAYYRCLREGTVAQMWSMDNPVTIQRTVFQALPVYRAQDDVRQYVEEQGGRSLWSDAEIAYMKTLPDTATVADPEIQDARVFRKDAYWMLPDADMVMYIGKDTLNADGEVISRTSWDGTALIGGEEKTDGTSLILVHSKTTGRWFVSGWNAPRG